MICPHPVSIPRPNGRGTRDRINIPCGKCAVCLSNRREDWSVRLLEEYKSHTTARFVTLTYNNEHLIYSPTGVPQVDKKTIQDFIKRLRERLDKPFRYYLVAEYGTRTFRPHYHMLAYGIGSADLSDFEKSWSINIGTTFNPLYEPIGNVHFGMVTMKSIMYTCKYHVNRGYYPTGAAPPFTLMSRKPGIGYGYVEKMANYHDGDITRAYYSDFERKRRLPRYFKNKLYSDAEREQLSSVIQNDLFSLDKINEFKRLNPGESYFRHIMDQQLSFERKFRSKNNFNDKF